MKTKCFPQQIEHTGNARLIFASYAVLPYKYSIVLGSENYYPRTGYVPADTFGIQPPFDVPGENFMAYKLDENAPDIHGTIEYAQEFGIA